MKPGTLTVVVGLPGAGKSTLVRRKQSSVSGLCVEDFHADAIDDSPRVQNSRHYRRLIEDIRAGRDCVIADIAFCDPQRRANLEEAVVEKIPAVQITWEYFENEPEKCKRNILQRNRERLGSDLEALEKFAKLYVIPDETTTLPVFEENPSWEP